MSIAIGYMLVENWFNPARNCNFRVQWARVQLLYLTTIILFLGPQAEPKPIILDFGCCGLYRYFCWTFVTLLPAEPRKKLKPLNN